MSNVQAYAFSMEFSSRAGALRRLARCKWTPIIECLNHAAWSFTVVEYPIPSPAHIDSVAVKRHGAPVSAYDRWLRQQESGS
jgi:hypothetical protein